MNIQREIQAIKARLDNIEAFLSGDQSQESSHASGDEGNYEFINFEVKKAKSIVATSSITNRTEQIEQIERKHGQR